MYSSFRMTTRDQSKIISFEGEGDILKRAAKYILPDELDFGDHRLVLMAGGNGVGKTTLFHALNANEIRDIDARCEKQRKFAESFNLEHEHKYVSPNEGKVVPYKVNINQTDGIVSWSNSKFNMRTAHGDDDVTSCAANFFNKISTSSVSEGQSLVQTIASFFGSMRYTAKDPKQSGRDIVFLIDEMDSGLSIDNIDWVASEIRALYRLYPKSQFIVFFNNYETYAKLGHYEDVLTLSMYDGKPVEFKSYEEYAGFIRTNQKKFCHKRFLKAKSANMEDDDD